MIFQILVLCRYVGTALCPNVRETKQKYVHAHDVRLEEEEENNPGAGRALIFSSVTRNSLVVLPLALALPPEWATIAAAVIVTQTMVELAGELIYIRLVPAVILRDR